MLPGRLASEEAPAEEAAEARVRWAVRRLAQQLVALLLRRRRLPLFLGGVLGALTQARTSFFKMALGCPAGPFLL